MRVRWEIEDGYYGKSRPQYTEVPDEELAECESEKERQSLIDVYVGEDFGQRITYSVLSYED